MLSEDFQEIPNPLPAPKDLPKVNMPEKQKKKVMPVKEYPQTTKSFLVPPNISNKIFI